MIALILSTILSLFFFTTFGFFITKSLKIPSGFVEKLLIGLVVCNTLSTIVSLVFPINFFVLLLFIGLGLCSMFFTIKELKEFLKSFYGNRYTILFSLSFTVIAFFISLSSPENYDTGLYHLQSIKWIEEYSVVPGLANLHGRFGFNPNIFTFYALTSMRDLFGQEIFSVNFTVFAILLMYYVNKLYSLFRQNGFSAQFVFYFFLFLMILRLRNLSSPSPDFVITTITLFVFARMVDLSSQKINSGFRNYIPILILSVYLLTVKLAALPILLLFVFVFVKYKSELLKSFWLLILFGLIMIPWLVRNVILTGWLIYPFPSLDLFGFDWKVPIISVMGEKESVTGWARDPGANYARAANMSFSGWFPIWWHRIVYTYKIFLIISISFPLIALVGQLAKKIKIDLFTNAVIITSLFGVLFWLLLAPDWRFGESFILIASMSPLLLFKSYFNPTNRTKLVFGTLMFVFFGIYTVRNRSEVKANFFHAMNTNSIKVPARIEIPKNLNFRTYNIGGVTFYVPTKGDRCFDHNIPCTPFPDETLILRGNTLQSGFKHALKNE